MSKNTTATTVAVSDVRPALVDTINAIALRALYAPSWMREDPQA